MQFITTDQRIAVENFELGLIYTVTFTGGRYFSGACIGKGADFVMFQRTAPELIFSLNMTTAADVASIEPLPADIGQILDYTGSVPVSIKTDGSPLLDYLITGNTIQNGTPTPENPIMPQGTGDLETSGEKAGQYKITISSANTTTPVYLGEVETTRKIRKLVLTGAEEYTQYAGGTGVGIRLTVDDMRIPSSVAQRVDGYCTHFLPATTPSGAIGDNITFGTSSNIIYMILSVASQQALNVSNFDEFKAWISAQYAAETPVCVWYVLATEETAVVNEPLMRIGDNADTLSYRQSGAHIPTTDGLNIFDIDTTVKPSEVYLKYFSPLL